MDDMEMVGLLSRIEERVMGVRDSLDGLVLRFDMLESRTRKLENWRWQVLGIALGAATSVSLLGAVLLP
jgi:hypothetical protein